MKKRTAPVDRAKQVALPRHLRSAGGGRGGGAPIARNADQIVRAELVDYLHDASDRRSEGVRRGLGELARGEIELA